MHVPRTPRSPLVLLAALAACAAPRPPVGWRAVPTGASTSLRGLAAVDAECAFVGGVGGTLLRTVDGGRSWVDVAPQQSAACDFRDVEAIDRERVLAMVAGQPARVYRTVDGGRSWGIAHEDPRPAAFFDAIARTDHRMVLFGDAIDERFVVLVSDDGGRAWQPAAPDALPPPAAGEAGFAASGTCVVPRDQAGDEGLFALVTGGGPVRCISFRPGGGNVTSELPMVRQLASGGAFSSAWRGKRGVVVGGDYRQPERSEGTAAWTDDGGVTWHAADAGGFRSAVCWLPDGGLLAVGSDGASWSGDGGATWQAFGALGFHAVACAGDGSVWACGSDGRAARLIFAR